MGFGDLKSEGELQALNQFLADKSYIDGWVPSQTDVAVFKAVGGAPASKYVNALRWFNQINSYSGDEKLTWPGVMKPVTEYGPTGAGTATTTKPAAKDDDSDDDFDPFASDDSEDEAELEKLKQERLAQYAKKKATKKVVIAKSSILLDVKPWDDETDMRDIEAKVRTIEADGLRWGASKLVPLAYGIKKLQISCVVEDDKIGTDFLEESITAFEDIVQSVDIAAFNKI